MSLVKLELEACKEIVKETETNIWQTPYMPLIYDKESALLDMNKAMKS